MPNTTHKSPEAIAAVIHRIRNPPLSSRRGVEVIAVEMIESLAARLAEVEAEVIEGDKQVDALLGRCNRAETALAETEALEMQHGAVIEHLTAERDTARAQVAATQRAYGVMEMEVRTFCKRVEDGEVRSKRTYAAFIDCLNVLPKTPADATAALTAMLDKARGETIEAAKQIADDAAYGRIQIDYVSETIDALHTPATRSAAKGGA